jgi:hypothetical protein
MPRTTALQKQRDREIEFAFRASCCDVPIKFRDHPRVYAEGRRIWANGGTDQDTLRRGLSAFVHLITEEYGS